MAWIPMYLINKDLEFLNDWLNQDGEIAFLISNGNKKWIAKNQHNISEDLGTQKFESDHDFYIPNYVEYYLWHIPSGDLPLFESDQKINPWIGWKELRTGANSRIPYFGAGYPGVIQLELKLPINDEIPISQFGWIGNHYKIIGNAADPKTEFFWTRLRKMVKKISTKIARCNYLHGKKEIFAFPNAYEEIKNGRACSLN
jgi:hypothetical protein